jgi:hypothetical protein
MSTDQYVKCPYCSKTVKNNETHLEDCTTNYIEGMLLWCYSCGEKNKKYSNSQLAKEDKSRCIDCVKSGKIQKFEPYDYLYEDPWRESVIPDKYHNGKKLFNAISTLNLIKVNELLLLNVDVNYIQQDTFYCYIKHRRLLSYNADGSEKKVVCQYATTTPLTRCVFAFGDSEINDSDRFKIIEIAKELIKFGASTNEPKKYYESRYSSTVIDDGLRYTLYKLLCD